jgi:predicted MFS family arabinose efflux permease
MLAPSMTTTATTVSERTIVLAIGAVQVVNILDFVIVTPLGQDFAAALDIPMNRLGFVGASYTAAACVSGLVGALFLDRFDRRKALLVAMVGLVLGTLSGALANSLATLLLARVVAGVFGGPATSIAYSIIADVIPPERRGKAMGTVMGSFSVASVLGVPAGLELARVGSWRLPFIAVAVLGAVVGWYAHRALPPMTKHLENGAGRPFLEDARRLVRPDVVLSYGMTFVTMAASFILIPYMSAYVIMNLGFPRAQLGFLYLVGGVVSFFTMRIVGKLVDRFGSMYVGSFGSSFVGLVVYLGFVRSPPVIPVLAIFVGFMLGMSFRNVAYTTLTTKVPRADERARFGSLQSAVQHAASAIAGFAATQLLTEESGGRLVGMPRVALLSIAIGLLLPPMLWIVERHVRLGGAAPR